MSIPVFMIVFPMSVGIFFDHEVNGGEERFVFQGLLTGAVIDQLVIFRQDYGPPGYRMNLFLISIYPRRPINGNVRYKSI
jgi:hypothetical protein